MEHRITVFAGPASNQLGAAVCDTLQVSPGLYECRRFPDGEAQIEVHESVRGRLPLIVDDILSSVAPLLAIAIQRNHHDESLADLRASE